MSKPYLAGLLLISPWALAASGSWSSESFGGTMTRGQQSVKVNRSRALLPFLLGLARRLFTGR